MTGQRIGQLAKTLHMFGHRFFSIEPHYQKSPFNSLSHPSLGWLYVFSSFLPPRPPPPPPPQRLLLLTSKPFQLNLRYLGQRKYRSGKMYWMTYWWPWPKVTAVTMINKNLLVCRIKWERPNQSLQNLVAIFLWPCLSPVWDFKGILLDTLVLPNFL